MNEEEVIQYLSTTPDFFARHTELLESMSLPHPVSGKVVSLLEYQVALLRQSTADYKAQFERLVQVARENEETMQKSRRLVLASLACDSLDDFVGVIDDLVRNDFGLSHHTLLLYDESIDSSIRTHRLSENESILSNTSSFQACYCGALPENEMRFLFPDDWAEMESVAVLPLQSRSGGDVKSCGVLVLGAESKVAFDQGKGTLFLQYLADLLSAILLRLIP
ncbi:DUF484 family protein [Marinomonas algarum]|uniref:DUF484 family protein n=1 Tax=Marinomonas algarum TaxID=2883105 RepID=A0A9X1LFC9_9GAMM|nr:DUF484 family protein [Marinomonas algarum]MCB5162913.1 DUF484 family protein [Marinomonas algarum]